jgi:hypothetical protein
MKAKLNNMISRYEIEREKIVRHGKHMVPADERRVHVIDEVLKALYELRR